MGAGRGAVAGVVTMDDGRERKGEAARDDDDGDGVASWLARERVWVMRCVLLAVIAAALVWRWLG